MSEEPLYQRVQKLTSLPCCSCIRRIAENLIQMPDVAVLHLRTTALRKCAAVPRRARIQGAKTFVSLNSGRESHQEEEYRAG